LNKSRSSISEDILRNFDSQAPKAAKPSERFANPDLRYHTANQKTGGLFLEKKHSCVTLLMAFNSSQFETKDNRDIMKNRVVPEISFDYVIFVMLHAVNEINVGNLIINSCTLCLVASPVCVRSCANSVFKLPSS
jgi:hypothetical protein